MEKQSARENTLNLINAWSKKRSNTAWQKIQKKYITEGLKIIAGFYYDLDCFKKIGRTYMDQGQYPVCGPAALAFYLVAHWGIDYYVTFVTNLYEKGTIGGYLVPEALRQFDASPDDFWGYSPTTAEGKAVCRVNWMVLASLAQKETAFKIAPDKNNRMMFTFVTEMKRDIQFLFGVAGKDIDRITSWGTTKKALKNLEEWQKTLNRKGTVFWLMHANALNNCINKKNESYTHLQISDLHWVVVLSAKKSGGRVCVKLHTWGKICEINVTHEEFRKMSYESLAFIPKTKAPVTVDNTPSEPSITRLDVTVRVADKYGAGTDHDVHFRMVNERGGEDSYLLDVSRVNDFERNSCFTYGVTLKKPIKVKNLTRFRLTCAFNLKSQKFIVSRVLVKDGSTGIVLADVKSQTIIQKDSPLVMSVNARDLLKKYK